MSMLKCERCEAVFDSDELRIVVDTLGLSQDERPCGWHGEDIAICPECGHDEYDKYSEESDNE